MSADLSDPNIVEKYRDITSFTSPTNWLLLSYGQSRDKLSLYASGAGGIEELRPHLAGDVFFALVREDRSFILISFVPEDISGVRRARALVHARAVGSLFKVNTHMLNIEIPPAGLTPPFHPSIPQAHHAAWTITKSEMLTEDTVRAKLKLPADGSPAIVPSQSVPANFPHLQYTNGRSPGDASSLGSPERRGGGGSQMGSPPASPNPKRRVTGGDATSLRSATNGNAPTRELPPTPTITIPPNQPKSASSPPPSSVGSISRSRTPENGFPPSRIPLPPSRQASSATTTTATSPSASSVAPTLLVTPTKEKSSPQQQQQAVPQSPRTAAQEQAAQSRAKWALENEHERRHLQRQRSQLEMQREAEAQQQALYDAERSARLRLEREEALRYEMDEDDRRRAIESEQARKLAAERAAEEQRRRDEVAAKKALEAQRRREEVALRIQREREAEAERERIEMEKARVEEENMAAKREIQQQFTNARTTGSILLTGNLTTQAHDSLYWRRRYFELSAQGLAFYKSSDTVANRLDLLPLEGKARAITEKHDELQSIPHSFAIEFHDGTMQLFFCDTADDKEVLIAAILQVAKL